MTVAIEADDFRAVLRQHAAGVVVITASSGERPVGFTATSFTSVSLDPPLVAFCLNRAASSWPTVSSAEYVAVHLLADHQEALARTFATSGADRFAEPTTWRPGPHGVPLLDDVPAMLICRVVQRVPAGDHAIMLAEPIEAVHARAEATPLLYHMGRYVRPA